MVDEGLHGWVEAVALAQLDGETFGEITGADAARIEPLDEAQNAFDPFDRHMKASGDLLEGPSKIAILIDRIDQDLPNQPARRIGGGEGQLRFQMVLEADPRRDIGFEIGGLPVAGPG